MTLRYAGELNVRRTKSGLDEILDLEEGYYDNTPRGKVIYRLDVIQALSCFDEETKNNYRSVIYGLIMERYTDEQKAKCINLLFDEDRSFRALVKYCFEWKNRKEKSMYELIMERIFNEIKEIHSYVLSFYANSYITVLSFANLYCYCICNKDIDISIPSDMRGEVVSYENGKRVFQKSVRRDKYVFYME